MTAAQADQRRHTADPDTGADDETRILTAATNETATRLIPTSDSEPPRQARPQPEPRALGESQTRPPMQPHERHAGGDVARQRGRVIGTATQIKALSQPASPHPAPDHQPLDTGPPTDDQEEHPYSDEVAQQDMDGEADTSPVPPAPSADGPSDLAAPHLPDDQPAAPAPPADIEQAHGVADDVPVDATVILSPAVAQDAAFGEEVSETGPAVGWLVVISGPGRGSQHALHYGQNAIGRHPEQAVALNFGDVRISRHEHAFVIYDEISRRFYLRDNGKANIIRHNGAPVLSPAELFNRDQISIGETDLMFVAICGHDFDWLDKKKAKETAEPGPSADKAGTYEPTGD